MPAVEALSAGIRTAFLAAASLSLAAIVCIFFVQRPKPAAPPRSES
jgi:hypothetical protein